MSMYTQIEFKHFYQNIKKPFGKKIIYNLIYKMGQFKCILLYIFPNNYKF